MMWHLDIPSVLLNVEHGERIDHIAARLHEIALVK
jgi:hypothetical protein